MPRTSSRFFALVFLLPILPARGADPTSPQSDFFERRVRPVLANHCLGCHGPGAAKGGLRLDTRANLLKGADSGPVVTSGDPEDSSLIEAVRRLGVLKMPPKKALDASTVADLETWVKMGLPWPEGPALVAKGSSPVRDPWREHWAARPVRDPLPPSAIDRAWPRTSIDPFILATLDAKGLAPSREAERPTLIRRASFDLTGLPPTPDEVAAFTADPRPDAFERLVDRLLASPRHGETWARHWLDVARYSDTKGYVFFEDGAFPWAYTYRDYVVRALNADVPYDRFLVEQIAADRLPGSDGRTLAALGFLSLGGRFMNNVHDIIDDRIDVVTRGLMGLTVTCARCHDHKFDPIPASDYYALYGVFASAVEPAVPPLLDPPPDTPVYRKFAAELRARESKFAEYVDAKRVELAVSARSRAAEYLLAAQASLSQPTTEQFMLIADGADLNPTMIIRWRSLLERTRRRLDPVFAPWHALAALPDADFASSAASYLDTLAARPESLPPVNPLVALALSDEPPKALADVARIYSKLLQSADALGREHVRRAALEGRAPGPLPIAASESLRAVFHGPDAPPDLAPSAVSNLELLPDRPSQAKLQELEKAVETWRATGPGAPPRAMALVDSATPVEPRVFLRGNPNNPGPAVPRRFLSALSASTPQPFADGGGRLDLARAIASADNPLTPRVLVNRVWMHHFGAPLVSTPGDFGLRSDPPTNPALLDHLAYQFTHGDGWSLKALHRRIMLSSTYRQSSDDRPAARAVDPENLFLWRMNRRRLDFEALRDAALFTSGRLDQTLGGPPFADVSAPPDAATRRTLYARIDRLNLPGLFRTFDFPDPNAMSPRRDSTTVPPQALFLMNHPFLIAASRALAARSEVVAVPDASPRVDRLYHLLYGRAPTAAEMGLAVAFATDPGGGWDRLAQALLMSNEFAFVD